MSDNYDIYEQSGIEPEAAGSVYDTLEDTEKRTAPKRRRRKRKRVYISPIFVFVFLVFCFPVGIILLLFFTRWGVFSKLFLTIFTLVCAFIIYEILVLYNFVPTPSLLDLPFLKELFTQ
ncbi:MAG: hypothetical protein LBL82_07570 [Oscillospiraceae bacterium]|jgi:hypothetical protein|nr:hypothetical protein [Oscillospiraceae bacterium]